jgi:hypothetical protein
MRWQKRSKWLVGSLLVIPSSWGLADEIPIISGTSTPVPQAATSSPRVAPVIVGKDAGASSTSSRSSNPGASGLIKLIQQPQSANDSKPSARAKETQTVPVTSSSSAAKPLSSATVAAEAAAKSQPIKALQSPLVVHRTPRLAVQVDTAEGEQQIQRIRVQVVNESPQAAGRTELMVTVPSELQLDQFKPQPLRREQQGEASLLLYSLEGLAGSDQIEISFAAQGLEDCRGLIHAVVTTEAEFSKLLEFRKSSTTEVDEPLVLETADPAPPQQNDAGALKEDAGSSEVDAGEQIAKVAPETESPSPGVDKPAVGAAKDLPLLIAGPRRAQKGATLVYSISLENLSDIDLGEVKIKTSLPEGVYLEGRRDLKLTDRLPAGQQRSTDLAIRAQRSGEFPLEFEAWHDGVRLAQQTMTIDVVSSDLKAGMGGPQSWSVDREATFVIDLQCEGEEPIKDVVVTLQLPENIQVTTVEHQAGYDEEQRLMAWRVVELQPGTSVKLHYKALGLKPGEAIQTLHVKTPDLNAPLKTSLKSEVKGSVGFKLNTNFLKR